MPLCASCFIELGKMRDGLCRRSDLLIGEGEVHVRIRVVWIERDRLFQFGDSFLWEAKLGQDKAQHEMARLGFGRNAHNVLEMPQSGLQVVAREGGYALTIVFGGLLCVARLLGQKRRSGEKKPESHHTGAAHPAFYWARELEGWMQGSFAIQIVAQPSVLEF